MCHVSQENFWVTARAKSWTGFHVESSWTVTGVRVEFFFQPERQQDMKKDRNSMWKKLKSPRGNCSKVLAGILAKILLTFWHENRAEQLSLTNVLIFWW